MNFVKKIIKRNYSHMNFSRKEMEFISKDDMEVGLKYLANEKEPHLHGLMTKMAK